MQIEADTPVHEDAYPSRVAMEAAVELEINACLGRVVTQTVGKVIQRAIDKAHGWQPIETAPKDGTLIDLTWMENGRPQEIWPMQWGHIQRNGLFPEKVGMWTASDGSVTWNDSDPDGAPSHWRPHQKSAPAND